MTPLKRSAWAMGGLALGVVTTTMIGRTSAFSQPAQWSFSFVKGGRGRIYHMTTESSDDVPFFAKASTVETVAEDTVQADEKPVISEEEAVRQEANDALAAVGWSAPMKEEELTSEDPFVQRIDAQIRREMGVPLEELLNPAKVVNLERDLFNLRSELAVLTGLGNIDVMGLSTEECDGGGDDDAVEALRKSIQKKETSLFTEQRAVFRGWLKNVFLAQAVMSLGLSWVMATNPESLFGGFEWYNTNSLDTSIRVLGFWWWWLFIVPSLRSRRPSGKEKKALDIAFLGTPLISILAPVATKDTAAIWFANLAVVSCSYLYAYVLDSEEDGDDDDDDSSGQPSWLKFIFKSLDFGSGRERGARN